MASVLTPTTQLDVMANSQTSGQQGGLTRSRKNVEQSQNSRGSVAEYSGDAATRQTSKVQAKTKGDMLNNTRAEGAGVRSVKYSASGGAPEQIKSNFKSVLEGKGGAVSIKS